MNWRPAVVLLRLRARPVERKCRRAREWFLVKVGLGRPLSTPARDTLQANHFEIVTRLGSGAGRRPLVTIASTVCDATYA
jgi:hypothetical protein